MAITLAQMIQNADKVYEMRLVAGRAGLSGFVRWVHIVEDSEIPEFMNGNELVFTTGIGHSGSEWLTEFAENLYKSKAAGLVVNLGQYIKSIPRETVSFCEQNAFPLFTLPWKVKLIDVTYDFCHRIISSEESETSLAAAMKNLIFQPQRRSEYAPVLERKGFHDIGKYCVTAVGIELPGKNISAEDWRRILFSARRVFANTRFASCMFVQERILIIVQRNSAKTDDSDEKLKSAIFECFSEKPAIHIGTSSVGLGYEGISFGYKEAVAAMKLARIKEKEYMSYDEIGVYKILFGVRSSAILADYVESTLGALIDNDRKTGENAAELLKCYLYNNCSVMETAEKLNVHRNTINHRLKSIREFLQTEFTEEEKMNLMIAFCAKEMLDAENNNNS